MQPCMRNVEALAAGQRGLPAMAKHAFGVMVLGERKSGHE